MSAKAIGKTKTTRSRSAPHAETPLAASPADDANAPAFRRALLRWYGRHRRDLPWRNTRDPYRIWISEIMLQQTRVAAVLDHYRLFLERFPAVETLAAASEDAVLAAWSGLGYYRRARMLRGCAKQIVQEHSRRFPETAQALETLPGIGRYTAAAIASIAFDEPSAVVDGNVERVLQRLLCPDPPRIDLSTPQVWQYAQALLDVSRPGDFNQAMMELGATVCLPRQPRCPQCPVRQWCASQHSAKTQTPVPTRQLKKTIWYLLSERNGSIRLVQRPKKNSLMPGMWELPHSSKPPHLIPPKTPWQTFRHSITITNYTVHVYRNTPFRNMPPPILGQSAKAKWIAIDRLPQFPITGLTRKILKAGGII